MGFGYVPAGAGEEGVVGEGVEHGAGAAGGIWDKDGRDVGMVG